MTTQKQQKTVDTQRQTVSEELDVSMWLAPLTSGMFLSLQNTIGNRAVRQLLQADVTQTERATQTAAPAKPSRPLIVNDDAQQLQPGQMRKTEFLDQLKSSVCSAVEDQFRNTMWSALGCPYLERWFSHYAGQDSQDVERALRLYVPEAAGRVNSASEYIPIVTEHVRRRLSKWAETGEMIGVPEEFADREVPRLTLVSSALSAIGRVITNAAAAVAGRRALLKSIPPSQ
jgi:hypothetical protein